jgi:hypothetical protein
LSFGEIIGRTPADSLLGLCPPKKKKLGERRSVKIKEAYMYYEGKRDQSRNPPLPFHLIPSAVEGKSGNIMH